MSRQIAGEYNSAQALFEKLFDFSPDAILVTDSSGHIREANPKAEILFGYSREELLDRGVESLIPERFRQIHPHHRSTYHADPHTRPMGAGLNLYGLRKDGSEFPVDIMLSPVQTDGESVVLVVVRDITQKKEFEDALRQSEERFRLLVEGAQDYAIFMLDLEGRIATWNSGAERIKGYHSEEILGQHFSRFYTKEDIGRGKPEFELNVVKAEGRYEDEGWRVRKDGSLFWADVIITALHDKHGKLIGFSKVIRDFTDRKRAEESLLVELSGAVLSRLDIQQMFSAIATSIQHLVPHDYAAISLYKNDTNQLHQRVLYSPDKEATVQDIMLPVESTPDGQVFTAQQPLIVSEIKRAFFNPKWLNPLSKAGVKSACWLPLKSQGKVIGTLSIGSRYEAAFKPRDTEMLLQIANPIAAALDNTYALRHLVEHSDRLKEEKRYLEEELRTEYSFEEIVGRSDGLRRVLKQVEIVSPTNATVLIMGETGTGKELIARAIHNLSPRRERTFVRLNCSAIPLGLLESELFGHEKGAFTGAITQRIGRLELAHQGTLFLDEIGDLPLELQPKLLRALQEKEIERLGGKKAISVDVRLIAATNRDLPGMIKEGLFRSDLYYRLRVFPVTVPSLRQRREDIPLLVNYFVTKHARRMNKPIDTVSGEVLTVLSNWHWPGNIRELENFIERAVILTSGHTLRAPLAELELAEDLEDSTSSNSSDLRTAERDHILRVLREAKGMIGGAGGAAAKLGLKRTTLNSKLKKLDIKKEDYT